MAEEKKDHWLGYLALTTVVFAVFATLSTFNGGKYSTQALLNQDKATNKWSHYQSKSMKGYLYDLQKEKLELELQEKEGDLSAKAEANVRKCIERCGAQIARYEKEKKEIMAEAQALESRRDRSQIHSRHFGYAIIFLQLAILLSGVAGFVKNKAVWTFSIVLGGIGIFLFLESFNLFADPLLRRLGLL